MHNASSEGVPRPDAGFETGEPKTGLIALFGVATILVLIVVILGIQFYYDRVLEQQIFVRVLEPVSQDLLELRARTEAQLHSYQFLDRAAGKVRLPIERAMELVAQEAAAGKVHWPTRPTPVLKPEQLATQPPVAAPQGGASAAPR